MMRILKHVLNGAFRELVCMPLFSEILSFQIQGGAPTFWYLGDPERATKQRLFKLYYTGDAVETLPSQLTQERYIGTAQGDAIVLHLFEVCEIE